MATAPSLALTAPDWLRLVGVEDDDMDYVDLETMIKVIGSIDLSGRRFDGMCFLLREDQPNEDVFLGLKCTDAQYGATTDLLRDQKLKSSVLVSPSWGDHCCPFAVEQGPRDQFVANFEQSCDLSLRLESDGLGISDLIRLDTGTDHLKVADDEVDGAYGRLSETFLRCDEIAVAKKRRAAVESEPPWFGINTLKNLKRFFQALKAAKALGLQVDLAHFIHVLLGTANPEHALLPPDWSWKRPTDDSAAQWDATLIAAWQECVDAFGALMIDLHVAQSDATQYGGGTHPKTGRHCDTEDPNGVIDLLGISKMWLCDASGAPNGRINGITFDGCMIGEAKDRAPLLSGKPFWTRVLKALVNVQTGCGYSQWSMAV